MLTPLPPSLLGYACDHVWNTSDSLRKFPKYSFKHIYECDEGREYTSLSGSDGACKLALARGKTALARVGGGQGNDDMYRSVINFNYAEPRKKHYHVLGGTEGMIGGGGGYLMGKFIAMSPCYILIISYVNTMPNLNGYHIRWGVGQGRREDLWMCR